MNTSEIKFELARDDSGNKLVKVSRPKHWGFSIQTNGNLPLTHNSDVILHNITMNEVQAHVTEFGTDKQKNMMGLSA